MLDELKTFGFAIFRHVADFSSGLEVWNFLSVPKSTCMHLDAWKKSP